MRINVTNNLPEDTTVHWHGLILPNQMDGAAEVTQPAIPPNATFSYEFTAEQHGTYFYHPHANPDRTQALGLYGALIIDPANPADEVPADHEYVIQIQEWLMREGLTYPAMPMDGAHPNFFTINGKAYPATDTIHMALGETLKFRFSGFQFKSNRGISSPTPKSAENWLQWMETTQTIAIIGIISRKLRTCCSMGVTVRAVVA